MTQDNLSRTVAALARLPRRVADDTNWIVLTGAPSSGKSTLLNWLHARGHVVHSEQARQVFAEERASGKSMKQVTSTPNLLVKWIFERNLKVHAATPRQQAFVFDRGLPDVLAFALADGVDTTPYIGDCGKYRFATAFVLERTPERPDDMVYHSTSELENIENACSRIYSALGAQVRKLPLYSEDRTTSVLNRIHTVEEEIATLSHLPRLGG